MCIRDRCRARPAAELAASAPALPERVRAAPPAAQAEPVRAHPDWCNLPWARVLQFRPTIRPSWLRLALSTRPRLWPISRSTVCRRCNRTRDRPALPTRRLFRLEPVLQSNSTTVSYTHLRAHETPEHLVCR